MAIKHVVTRGFIGSGTGIDFVPTLGYSIGAATAGPTVPGAEYSLRSDRLHYALTADRMHYASTAERMQYVLEEE